METVAPRETEMETQMEMEALPADYLAIEDLLVAR